MPNKKRLGDMLVEAGELSLNDLNGALEEQRIHGGRLGQILVEKKLVAEQVLIRVLAQQLGLTPVRLSTASVDPRAVALVGRETAERYLIFAYELTGRERAEQVSLAMADPTDLTVVDEIAFNLSRRVRPMLASPAEIRGAIRRYYGGEPVVKEVPSWLMAPSDTPSDAAPADDLWEVTDAAEPPPVAVEPTQEASWDVAIEDEEMAAESESATTGPAESLTWAEAEMTPVGERAFEEVDLSAGAVSLEGVDPAPAPPVVVPEAMSEEAAAPLTLGDPRIMDALLRVLEKKGLVTWNEIAEELMAAEASPKTQDG